MTALLLAVAFAFRSGAALLFPREEVAPLRMVRWPAVGLSAWLLGAALGAWTPLWVPTVVVVGFALADVVVGRSDRRAGTVGVLGDGAIFVAVAAASLPPLGVLRAVGGALALAATGAALDRGAERLGDRTRRWTVVAGLALVAGVVAYHPARPAPVSDLVTLVREGIGASDPAWQGITVGGLPGSVAVELPGGVRGWLDRPGSRARALDGTRAGALLFHGAHAAGSAQPTAVALRRGLLEAGFVVLAVDRSGFGASPSPEVGGSLGAWDPVPAARAALRRLREEGVGPVVAVGHSMGVSTVLGMMAARTRVAAEGSGAVELDAAVLLGGGLLDPAERDDYWYGRFLDDHDLDPRGFPQERWRTVRARFDDPGALARNLPDDHPPTYFVRFGREHANLRATRDSLYALLPGTRWTRLLEGTTHYLNTAGVAGVVVGDVQPARRLAAELGNLGRALLEAPVEDGKDRAEGDGSCTPSDGAPRTVSLWGPWSEWTLCNPGHPGNPFDLEARATFVHEAADDTVTTGLFYDGGEAWRFRFTGPRPGEWRFVTASSDDDLAGFEGVVRVLPDTAGSGFVTGRGPRWTRTGSGRAFVPQLVMYREPRHLADDAAIERDVQLFLEDHGFNGFHVPVLCAWFRLEAASCDGVREPDPDLRTFRALERLIEATYRAGGMVHLWMWGDAQRGMTPARWGLGGPEDRRLQRYLAARLGPLPGWTMGYGFDLWEWASEDDLAAWHAYVHEHLGWPHLLGGRGPSLEIAQIHDGLDYRGYEQHRPDYATYRATFEADPDRPALSEDRFRLRDDPVHRAKDYTMERVRHGLWESTLAGGVGNVWGNLLGVEDVALGSAPFPEPDQVRTWATFFEDRFAGLTTSCDDRSDAPCRAAPDGSLLVVYARSTDRVEVDLEGLSGTFRGVGVDAGAPYREIEAGTFGPGPAVWSAPHFTDWALALRRVEGDG